MPAPLIEFSQFAHPQRWWLRRGPPPWLDDSRWFARAFRASLVLGAMGTITGWLTIAGAVLLRKYEEAVGSVPFSDLWMVVWPGLLFGLGVLVPLSRWLGRGWIMTILSVPVSMLACYVATMVFYLAGPFMGNPPSWVAPYGNDAAGFLAGFAGGAIIAAWMGHPTKLSSWGAGGAASLMASLHCGLFFLTIDDLQNSWLPDQSGVIVFGWLYVGFQSLTAAGLGFRLWISHEPRTK